ALTENVLRAGILNDIVHGEKERLELELGDQPQFVLDRFARGARRAAGPALDAAALRESAQVAGRRFARGDDLLGILVAQLIETEGAALCNDERLREQRLGIDLP